MRTANQYPKSPLSPRTSIGLFLQGPTGVWGEKQAYLLWKRSGIITLARNWYSNRLEADIIGLDRKTIVVGEVKTRHCSLQETFPAHGAVTDPKLHHAERLGYRFMSNHGPLCRRFGIRTFRIDIIEVYYREVLFGCRVKTSIHWLKGVASPQ